ncbi:MAG TPA: tetratricopeptide repeat protein [Terriglobales bacterium]
MNRVPALACVVILTLSSFAGADDPSSEPLLKTGRADQALRVLNAEVQNHPDDAAAYNLLSRIYFQLEIWDTALRMAEKSVVLEPHNSLYQQWLGRSAGRKAENSNPFTAFGLARRVKVAFERAVALDPNNIGARADLAEYYLEAPAFLGGDRNKARQQGDAILPHDPGLANYIYGRVEEKQGSGRAEEQYKKAIASSGNSARYWVELAYYYRRAGRPQDMEWALAQSLAAPHHDGMPAYDGAFILLRTGRNFPGAIQMLRQYLNGEELSEDGPAFRAQYLLGELLEKQGDRQGAAGEFRSALALAAQFRPARDALARVSR